MMGYSANWRRIARHFEDRFRVLVYDSRGHGRSVHADQSSISSAVEAYSPDRLAEDLKGILDDLGWNHVNVVGHSMGGRVAYTFAAAHPSRVEKLVIVDIGPDQSPNSGSTAVRILDQVPVPFRSRAEAKAWFENDLPKVFSDVPNAPALGAWLYANITEDSSGRAVWRFDAEGIRWAAISAREHQGWDTIRSLRVPTLLIRGELSRDLPRSEFDRMLTENSWIEGVEIPNAGHWVHSEAFQPFVGALDTFLAQAE
jgi:esterase